MLEAVREGRYVWPAPVGYSNGAFLNGKPTIAKNETAPLVLESFNLVVGGLYTTAEIWSKMVAKGLKTEKSGKPISKQYFHEMLHKKLYTGLIEKFGESHMGKFEPTVTDELFEQAQRMLKNKGHKVSHYKTDNPDFPLRRFVFHPSGLKLTGSKAKGLYPSYRFNGVSGNYDRDDLEKDFMSLMDSYAFGQEQILKLKRLVKEKFDEATIGERKNIEKQKKRIQELAEQQTVLIKKNLKGVLSDAVLTKQLDLVEKETLEAEIVLAQMNNTDVSADEAVVFSERYLQAPSAIWEKADISTKKKLQWFQFPAGIVFDGKKFGTPKIASVFKAKELILNEKSARVDPSGFEPLTSSLQMRRSTN